MKSLKELDTLAPSTKKHYLFYLSKINGGKLPTNAKTFFDIEKIKENIKDYSKASKLLIINAIMTILSKYKSLPYIRMHKVYKFYRETIILNNENDDDGEKNVPINELNQAEPKNTIPSLKNITNPLNRFLLALYTLQTPRRSKDYYKMKIINKEEEGEDKSFNYLVEDAKIFIFNNYKTSKIYHTQKIKMSEELWNEYQAFKPLRNYENNFLLQKENGKPVDNNQFISYHLNMILGKGKSVNYLRHYYVKQNLTEEHNKIEQVAKDMGHSFATNNIYKNN
jgi:hypothetical protein